MESTTLPSSLREIQVKRYERALLLIRFMVGGVFLSEGIQKFLYPESLGAGRFTSIGIPYPEFTAPFVGGVEIVFGAFLLVGFLCRLSAIPLLIDISVAILTTKAPMFAKKGFWPTLHESRVDYCMFLGLVFLILVGGGAYSMDRILNRKP